MTLPEALLKRLAKRGIIQGDGATPTPPPRPRSAEPSSDKDDSEYSSEQSDEDDSADDRRDSENEEIIAEDYDEYDHVNPDAFEYPVKKKSAPGFDWTEKMKQKMTKRYGYQSVDGCQNKYNIHHLCTMYCVKRYGEVEFEIEKEYDKRVKRLLERYPLPKNWRKEYDIGCKAFYFYNKDTRIVSWLPPTHPDAKLSKSAKLLRRELMEQIKEKEAGSKVHPPPTSESHPLPLHPSGPMPQQAVVGQTLENLKPPIVNPPKRPFKHPLSREDEKRSRPAAPGGGIKPDRGDRGEYRDRNRDRERDRDRLRERDRDRDRERRERERSPGRTEDYRPGRDKDRERDRVRDRERDREGGRGKQPKNATPLDPMDPAAYSDIPRGNWASGLEAASSKKEKEEKKKSKPKEDSEDEHEVLKISTLKEFTQEDEEDNDADE